VFIGFYNQEPNPVSEEVMDYKWVFINDVIIDMTNNPNKYTSWFTILMQNSKFLEILKKNI